MPFLAFPNLRRNLHIFLDIPELRVENKKNNLEKTVVIMWYQIF